ncbi:methyltransferase-like protein, partial [Leptotrombidium deliense]
MSNSLNTQGSNIDSSDALVSEALDHITAYWRPQLINTASELKIYDFLSKEPMSTDELAKATGTHSETLFRFMRALANIDVFKLDHNQKWTTTPLATIIFTQLKNYASLWLDSYSLLTTLTDVVKTGRNHFEEHYGLPFYEWCKSKPTEFEKFNIAMAEFGNFLDSKVTEIYDFSQFKCIVDVGGGRGVFMSEMLKSAPNVTGI